MDVLIGMFEGGEEMPEWRLTQEETVKAVEGHSGMVALEQLIFAVERKLVEWLDEPCEHKSPNRRVCFTCWQSLRWEAGLDQ